MSSTKQDRALRHVKAKSQQADSRKTTQQKEIHAGHRERLRQRLIENAKYLSVHELVETLLTYVSPRQDTKVEAKQLLHHFGSLCAIFQSESDSFKTADAMNAYQENDSRKVLPLSTKNEDKKKSRREQFSISNKRLALFHLVGEIAQRMALEKIEQGGFIKTRVELIEYLKISISARTREYLKVFFFNQKNRIIFYNTPYRSHDIYTTSADPSYVDGNVRAITREAILRDAATVIIAHNHPGGDPKPSKADILMTKNLAQALNIFNIALHDHIIIAEGDNNYYSMRDERLIPYL